MSWRKRSVHDYSHAARTFLHAFIKLRFSFRESLWWAQRSMIGPDDWPLPNEEATS